ncbi:17160_t:CDS:2, partial [Funneliformis geosporum]
LMRASLGKETVSGISTKASLKFYSCRFSERSHIILLKLTLDLQRNWAHSFTQSQEDNPTKRHHQETPPRPRK